MLEIMRPTKCYFEEFLFTFRAYELVVSDMASSPQTNYKIRAQIDRADWWPYCVMKEGVRPLPCPLLSNGAEEEL